MNTSAGAPLHTHILPWWLEEDVEPELLAFSRSLPPFLRAGPNPWAPQTMPELEAREQAYIEVNAGPYLEYLPFEVSEYEDVASWVGVTAQPSMCLRIPGTSKTVFLYRLAIPVSRANPRAVQLFKTVHAALALKLRAKADPWAYLIPNPLLGASPVSFGEETFDLRELARAHCIRPPFWQKEGSSRFPLFLQGCAWAKRQAIQSVDAIEAFLRSVNLSMYQRLDGASLRKMAAAVLKRISRPCPVKPPPDREKINRQTGRRQTASTLERVVSAVSGLIADGLRVTFAAVGRLVGRTGDYLSRQATYRAAIDHARKHGIHSGASRDDACGRGSAQFGTLPPAEDPGSSSVSDAPDVPDVSLPFAEVQTLDPKNERQIHDHERTTRATIAFHPHPFAESRPSTEGPLTLAAVENLLDGRTPRSLRWPTPRFAQSGGGLRAQSRFGGYVHQRRSNMVGGKFEDPASDRARPSNLGHRPEDDRASGSCALAGDGLEHGGGIMSTPDPRQRYVLGFAFTPSREFVLLIRKRKPEWQAGRLNGIGGKVESTDESTLVAMKREAVEEAGITAEWQWFARMNGETWQVECYRAFDVTGFEQREEEELMWCPAHSPSPDWIENLQWLIPLALGTAPNGETYSLTALIPK